MSKKKSYDKPVDKTQSHWEQNPNASSHMNSRNNFTGAKYGSGKLARDAEKLLHAKQEEINEYREQNPDYVRQLAVEEELKSLGYNSSQHFLESAGYLDGEETTYVDPNQGSMFGGHGGADNQHTIHEARVRTAVQDTPIRSTGDPTNPFEFDVNNPRYQSMYGAGQPPLHLRTALRRANQAPNQEDDYARTQAQEAMPRQMAVDSPDMYNQYTTTIRDEYGGTDAVQNIDDLSLNLAKRYSRLGMPASSRKPDRPMSMGGLASKIRTQLLRGGDSQLQSFGTDHMVSHLDSLPTPESLGINYPTLNMAGGRFDPDWKNKYSADVLQNDIDNGGRLHYQESQSMMATLTGSPYLGMHKDKYKPEQLQLLKEQQSIAVEARGILKAGGISAGYDMSGYKGGDKNIINKLRRENRKIKRGGTEGFDPADSTAIKLPHQAYEEASQFDELARVHGLDEARAAMYGEGEPSADKQNLGYEDAKEILEGDAVTQANRRSSKQYGIPNTGMRTEENSFLDAYSSPSWMGQATIASRNTKAVEESTNEVSWGGRKAYMYSTPPKKERKRRKRHAKTVDKRENHKLMKEYLATKDERGNREQFRAESNPFAEPTPWYEEEYVEEQQQEANPQISAHRGKASLHRPTTVTKQAREAHQVSKGSGYNTDSSYSSTGVQTTTVSIDGQTTTQTPSGTVEQSGSRLPEITQLANKRESKTVSQELMSSMGLTMDTAEQGSAEWRQARTGLLTSTGVKAALTGEGTYGGTFADVVQGAVNQSKNPEAFSRVSNPNFDAGQRGEELGKAWFEKKFGVDLLDAGLITNPNFKNQGTSVDSFIGNADGGVNGLAEFKFAPNRTPDMRKEMQKHYFQMQHQMMLTGQDTATLVQGYDPMGRTPQAGNEANYKFMTDVMSKDSEFESNFKKALEVSGGTLGKAVESGDADAMRSAYLDAMNELHPNGGYKGFTEEEKKEQKQESKEASDREKKKHQEEKDHRTWEKQQTNQRAKADKERHKENLKVNRVVGGIGAGFGAGVMGGAGGIAGSAMQGALGLARTNPIIAGVVGGLGLAVAGHDMAQNVNNIVGTAYDLGTANATVPQLSSIAMQHMGMNEQQATKNTHTLLEAKQLASVGEMDALANIAQKSQGKFSLSDLMSNTPEELASMFGKRTRNETSLRRSGLARSMGLTGFARTWAFNDSQLNEAANIYNEDREGFDIDTARKDFADIAGRNATIKERAMLTGVNSYNANSTLGDVRRAAAMTGQATLNPMDFMKDFKDALDGIGEVKVDINVSGGSADAKVSHMGQEVDGAINTTEVQ